MRVEAEGLETFADFRRQNELGRTLFVGHHREPDVARAPSHAQARRRIGHAARCRRFSGIARLA
jgi:hypothetical protein